MTDVEAQESVRAQWTAHPCGTGDFLDGVEPESLAYFDRIRDQRYLVTDTWMSDLIDFSGAKGKDLLEIGYGIGTDLVRWAEGGARVHGIDATPEHHRLASLNFELHGIESNLRVGDAAKIDYPDATFDMVYSNGVLHHTPKTVRCVGEIWRVLKPGGRFLFTMYHRHSLYHWLNLVLYRGYLKGERKWLGWEGLLSTIEYGADGINLKPLVKLYSRQQLHWLLEDFSHCDIRTAHLTVDQLPGGRFLPKFLGPMLAGRFGWYLVADARK